MKKLLTTLLSIFWIGTVITSAQTDSTIFNHVIILMDRGETSIPKSGGQQEQLKKILTVEIPNLIEIENLLKNGDLLTFLGYGLYNSWNTKKNEPSFDNYLSDSDIDGNKYALLQIPYAGFSDFKELSEYLISDGKFNKSFFSEGMWGIQSCAIPMTVKFSKGKFRANNTYIIQIFSKVVDGEGKPFRDGENSKSATSELSYLKTYAPYLTSFFHEVELIDKNLITDFTIEQIKKLSNSNYTAYITKLVPTSWSTFKVNPTLFKFSDDKLKFSRATSGYKSHLTVIYEAPKLKMKLVKLQIRLKAEDGSILNDTIITDFSTSTELRYKLGKEHYGKAVYMESKAWTQLENEAFPNLILNPYDKSEIAEGLNIEVASEFTSNLPFIPYIIADSENMSAVIWYSIYFIIILVLFYLYAKNNAVDKGQKAELGSFSQLPDNAIEIDFNNENVNTVNILHQHISNTKAKRVPPFSWFRKVNYKHNKVWAELSDNSGIKISENAPLILFQIADNNAESFDSLNDIHVNADKTAFGVFINLKAIEDYTNVASRDGLTQLKFKICSQSQKDGGVIKTEEYKCPIRFKRAKLLPEFDLQLSEDFKKGFVFTAREKVHLGNLVLSGKAMYNGNSVGFSETLNCKSINVVFGEHAEKEKVFMGKAEEVAVHNKPEGHLLKVEKNNSGEFDVTDISSGVEVVIPVFVNVSKFQNPDVKTEHSFFVRLSAKSGDGNTIPFDGKELKFVILQDTTFSGLVFRISGSTSNNELFGKESHSIRTPYVWLSDANNKLNFAHCFRVTLGNRAENGGQDETVRITNLKFKFFIAEDSAAIISPIKFDDLTQRRDISEVFKIDPQPTTGIYNCEAKPHRNLKEFQVMFSHGKIEEILNGQYVKVECVIEFHYTVVRPTAEEHAQRHEEGTFVQNIFFQLTEGLGSEWLALDLGTSAIVSYFSDGSNDDGLLDLQQSLKNLMQHKSDVYTESQIAEFGTPFVSSLSILNTETTPKLCADSYSDDIIQISPPSGKLIVADTMVLPFLKSLIGYETLPNPKGLYDNFRYSNCFGEVRTFAEGKLSVQQILLNTYNSVLRDFINPAVLQKNSKGTKKIILTVPNTFTPRHRDYIKEILKQDIHKFVDGVPNTDEWTKPRVNRAVMLYEDAIEFISESDAVASYYVTYWNRLNSERDANVLDSFTNANSAKTEYVLVFDMGAGTLDLTYFSVNHGQGASKTIEILAKNGNSKAGNYLDYVLAKQFTHRYMSSFSDPSEIEKCFISRNDSGAKLKRLIKDIIKPNLYGEGNLTHGRKNGIIQTCKLLIPIVKIDAHIDNINLDDVVRILEKVAETSISVRTEYESLIQLIELVQQTNTKLENTKKYVETKGTETVADALYRELQRVTDLEQKTAKLDDSNQIFQKLYTNYKVKSADELLKSLSENEKQTTTKISDFERMLSAKKEKLSTAEKLWKDFDKTEVAEAGGAKLEFKYYIQFFTNLGDNKVQIENSIDDLPISTKKEDISTLSEKEKEFKENKRIFRIRIYEYFNSEDVSDLKTKVLAYKQAFEDRLREISDALGDKVGVYPSEQSVSNAIKEVKTQIVKMQNEHEKDIEPLLNASKYACELLKIVPTDVTKTIKELNQEFTTLKSDLANTLGITEPKADQIQKYVSNEKERNKSISDSVLKEIGMSITADAVAELRKLESELKAKSSELSHIGGKEKDPKTIKDNLEFNMRQRIEPLFTAFSEKYVHTGSIKSNCDNLEKLAKTNIDQATMLWENNNVLIIEDNDLFHSAKLEINLEDIRRETDEFGNSTEYGKFLTQSTEGILQNLFGLFGIDKHPIDTVILTGRSVNLKGIRDRVFETIRKINQNIDFFSVNLTGDELKQVVAKGAIPYATHYRLPDSDIKFNERRIFAKYGLLTKSNAGWKWIEFLNPNTDINFTNTPRGREAKFVKTNLDLFTPTICYFVQTYLPEPHTVMDTAERDYVSILMSFKRNDAFGEQGVGAKDATVTLTLNDKNEMYIHVGTLQNTPQSAFKVQVDQNELFNKVMWPYL